MSHIPRWFRFPHLIIPICAIIVLYFVYQIIYNVFWKHSTSLQLHKLTKYMLICSLSISYTYLIATSFQSINMFIPASTWIYPLSLCPFLSSYRMFSYCTGRILSYVFFILRTNDVFKDSVLKFRKRYIIILIIYPIAILTTIVLPATFIYYSLQNWSIKHYNTNSGNIGTFCIQYDKLNSNASDYIKYVFLWGAFQDTFYAFLTIFLMISKLFILIVESENKRKSIHSRFSIRTQLSSMSAPQLVPDTSDPNRKNSIDSINHNNNMIALSNISSTLDQNANNKSVIRLSNISIANMSNVSNSAPPKSPVTENDAIDFHKKTEDQNELILIISKFFILACCVIFSSQFILILFLVRRDIVLILYSVDTFVNIICLYLSFSFSSKYYEGYLCGRFCTVKCFPLIKTITMQCSSYERHYKERNKQDIGKCCIYCKCCCFGYCCDENINWESTKNIYSLAQFEVELMVLSGNRTEQTEKQANDGK
eukprot:387618_1